MFARLEDFRFARWVKRLNRTAQICLSLLLVAGLNYVAARHFKRWDLTPNKIYSLSAETLARLDQSPTLRKDQDTPLQLILVVQQDQLNADSRVMVDRIRTLLKEYEYAAANLEHGKIPLKIEEVDPERNTTRIKQLEEFSSMPLTNSDNLPQLIVVHGKRARSLLRSELYGTTYTGEATDFRGENAITSAILDVTETKIDKIYFTTHHGEANIADTERTGISNLGDALRLHDFQLANIDLSSGGLIPDDPPGSHSVVVIDNPVSPFLPEEVQKLRRYLNEKNGRVMLFLSPLGNPDQHRVNGLEPLLREWGIESPNLMVAELDSSRLTSENLQKFNPVEDPKLKHKITEKVALSEQTVLLATPRPVQTEMSAPEDIRRQVHELLASSPKSYAMPMPKTINDKPVAVDPTTAIKGPISVAAISERRASEAADLPGGKLLVYGDSYVASNLLFNWFGNRMLLLRSVDYLSNHENMLNIRPQIPQQFQLKLVTEQYKGLGWRLGMLPAAMALIGLVVCWLRNRS